MKTIKELNTGDKVVFRNGSTGVILKGCELVNEKEPEDVILQNDSDVCISLNEYQGFKHESDSDYDIEEYITVRVLDQKAEDSLYNYGTGDKVIFNNSETGVILRKAEFEGDDGKYDVIMLDNSDSQLLFSDYEGFKHTYDKNYDIKYVVSNGKVIAVKQS